MPLIIIERGNIFDSDTQTIVNTVNCVGVMGKGIAEQFKKMYPDMFRRYAELCEKEMIEIGKLWLYKTDTRWILNFPTKTDWRFPSKTSYLEKGLTKFIQTYESKGITSISFPLLGSSNGQIPAEVSLEIMKKYLKECSIPVYIYLNGSFDKIDSD